MAVPEIERRWIDKFQENLSIIRKVSGWTTQELADELGVARQTVSNLETGKTPMSKLQYLALRTVFNAEIAERDNRDLARVITTLVDDPLRVETVQQVAAGDNGTSKPDADATSPGMQECADRNDESARSGTRAGLVSPGATMRILTVITGALASGAAAGALAFLMFPDGGRR